MLKLQRKGQTTKTETTSNSDEMARVLASLSTPAHLERKTQKKPKKPKKVVKAIVSPFSDRSSRCSFFFRLGLSEYDKQRKERFSKKKDLPPSDQDVDDKIKSYRSTLPVSMEDNIKKVRDFFLEQIVPLTLSAEAGVNQAMDVLSAVTEDEVDPKTRDRLLSMLNTGVNLRLSKFLVEYLELSKDDADALLNSIRPAKPASIVLPPLDKIVPEHPAGYVDEKRSRIIPRAVRSRPRKQDFNEDSESRDSRDRLKSEIRRRF